MACFNRNWSLIHDTTLNCISVQVFGRLGNDGFRLRILVFKSCCRGNRIQKTKVFTPRDIVPLIRSLTLVRDWITLTEDKESLIR